MSISLRPRLRTAAATVLTAALLAAITSLAPTAAQAAELPALTNPTFADVSPNGVPAGWGTWAPAGAATVTVDQSAGPEGGPAVAIASDSGPDARLALTQRIDVDSSTARELTLTGWVRGDGLTGGFSMLRIQAYDAAGNVVVPVNSGPYLTGTFDWRTYFTDIVLPENAARISVEPILDRAGGTIWFADLSITETVDDGATLTASPNERGPVELSWAFEDVQADRYAVHRTEGTTPPTASPETRLKVALAPTTADATAEPGTTYTYLVLALDAEGEVLATSPSATTTTAGTFADRTVLSLVTALVTDDGTHISWAVADGEPTSDLTVQVGSAGPTSVEGYEGSVQAAAASPGTEVVLRSGGTELARAEVGASQHPRSLVDADVAARIQADLAAGEPTITGAWNALTARLDGTGSAYPGSATELYRARDAAFAYAVTGEQSYAQDAYDAIMAGADWITARETNMGLELGRGALNLAPAYDLAHAGWTEAQSADVRDLMTRTTDLLSTYHHDTLDGADRASNWVAVTHGTELALLLAARGDGDFGTHDERITYLINQVARHLQDGYTETGWTQEGWDYFHYAQLYLFPSLFMAQDAGVRALDPVLADVDFWNLALHVVSSRADGDVSQFGVSGPANQVSGTFPLLFSTAPDGVLPGLKHLYDHVQGVATAEPRFDDVHSMFAVLYYPSEVSSDPADMSGEAVQQAQQALLDDEAGFYAFRSDVAGTDDTLISTSNRNTQHKGWAAAETFALSWMGHDTTWAQQGSKSHDPLLWSKPLVDGELEPFENQYNTVRGEGVSLASRAFEGQGGGYVQLDGSANFEVTTAEREQVVDLAPGGDADAIVAIHDTFADTTSHSWDWQLRPDETVTIAAFPDGAAHEPLFTFTGTDGATLSGFVPDREDLTVQVIDQTLRLTRTGATAEFGIVLATSASGALEAELLDGVLLLDGRVIDLAALASVEDGFPTETDDATQPPAVGVLSSDNGWDTGLRDGDYTITMNMWWGSNASRVHLYEDGTLIASERLDAASPAAQEVEFDLTGRTDGDYVYTATLVNSAGSTTTAPLTVAVTDASPGVPVLSHDNWDGDGSFTLTADLWWGTNADRYRLYQGEELIANGELETATPGHQRMAHEVASLEPGSHVYRVEWINDAGSTSSRELTVRVR
ncbi:hypothetical protein IM660_02405 [Ruania alkalisoli]|uniref:Uncharacterized protein n=1 Tax=Ruania alkalisoli TaxID=2779775 RepID=A0A7M1SX27_9MICO|nr:hypothetical protein [Ruania alkalisoli]QOR71183.1 hypothetical protein IM660_02405 [Ruania alkalisoli]